jgi:hypothetical protein
MRFLFFLFLPCLGFAQTTDPYNGVRVALFGAQSILSTPPLPTLEGGGKSVTTVQVGYFTAKAKNPIETVTYDGDFSGGSAGLSYTGKSQGRNNFFALVMFGQVNGSMESRDSFVVNTTKLSDVVTDTSIMAFGTSFRFSGTESGAISAGILLAPVIINLKTSFKVTTNGVLDPKEYSSNPTIYGGIIGLQYKIRIDNILFLPYALYMYEFSDRCKVMDATAAPPAYSYGTSRCTDFTKVDLPASFSAVGFNLGYKSLNINVYSQMSNDASMNFISGQQYNVSFSLGL